MLRLAPVALVLVLMGCSAGPVAAPLEVADLEGYELAALEPWPDVPRSSCAYSAMLSDEAIRVVFASAVVELRSTGAPYSAEWFCEVLAKHVGSVMARQ